MILLTEASCFRPVGRKGLVIVTNWHFSHSFHFYFSALTLIVKVQSLDQRRTYIPRLSISPSNFASDHQEIQKARVFSPINVANTTLKTTTDGPFQDKTTDDKGYLLPGRTTGPETPSKIGESARSLISELTKASPSKVSTRTLSSNL